VVDPSLGPICFLINANKSPAHHSIFGPASSPALPVDLLGLFRPVACLPHEISPRDEFTDLIFLRALVSVFVNGHFSSIVERGRSPVRRSWLCPPVLLSDTIVSRFT
jgi:hypothetical protein